MPLMRCQKDGKKGWKWGKSGHCYTGENAKEKAKEQGRAIKARETSKGVDFMSKGEYTVSKSDETLNYTLGVAYPVDEVDKQEHFAKADVVRKAAWDYMRLLQGEDDITKLSKSIFEEIIKAIQSGNEIQIDVTDMAVDDISKNIRDMHNTDVPEAEVVECYQSPVDFTLGEEEVKKGDWLLGVVWPEEQFEKILSGERVGYSIHGKGVCVEVDEGGD